MQGQNIVPTETNQTHIDVMYRGSHKVLMNNKTEQDTEQDTTYPCQTQHKCMPIRVFISNAINWSIKSEIDIKLSHTLSAVALRCRLLHRNAGCRAADVVSDRYVHVYHFAVSRVANEVWLDDITTRTDRNSYPMIPIPCGSYEQREDRMYNVTFVWLVFNSRIFDGFFIHWPESDLIPALVYLLYLHSPVKVVKYCANTDTSSVKYMDVGQDGLGESQALTEYWETLVYWPFVGMA